MCGFVGFIDRFDRKKKENIINECLNKIVHRGPDSAGTYIDESIALGFRRLSILDLSANGDQPMYNEDKSMVILFNGEIYNFLDLKEKLEKKGHIFKSNTDTEVIIHGYEEYGEKIVNKLRGMFSFVIWNIKEKELFGCRDYYGIKPFYYGMMDDLFIFGSEIKSFLVHPNFKKELNNDALRPYLTFQYSTQLETFFKNVYRLEPGCYFKYKNGKLNVSSYYEFKFDEGNKDLDYYVDEIDKELKESVNVHKISDVKVGSFLSGGVDSSYVTKCLMPDKTFSVGFENKKYDETKLAKDLCEKLNIDNISKSISADEFFESLPKIQYYSDEPHANLSAVPLYFVSKLAREYVTVVLSGEGADEMFGGYFEYLIVNESKKYRSLPKSLRYFLGKVAKNLPYFKGRNFLIHNGLPLEDYYIGRATVFEERDSNKILKKKFKNAMSVHDLMKPYFDKVKAADELTKKQYIDFFFWLPNDILLKADKMTMANSIELRVPFLDKEMMKVATSIPSKYRQIDGISKYPLRKAAEANLPEEWAQREKIGFPVPFMWWIREEKYYKKIRSLFEENFVKEFFDQKKIIKLLDKHYENKANNAKKVYSIYCFLIWYKVYFMDGVVNE